MYDDLKHNMPIEEFVPKYCQITDDIMASEQNIANTNIRCRNVANEVRQRLGKKHKYEIGETLIARKWVREPRINVNIRYIITNIDDKQITFKNISDEENVTTLNEEQVDRIFIYSHCATTHSSEGARVNQSMSIHEWEKPYLVSREWLWKSLYLNRKFDKEMELNMIRRYFESKVDGYKSQEKRASREIDEEDYVDVEWCMDKMKGACEKRNVRFDFEIKHGRWNSNMTAQRLCNDYAHYKSNIVPWCCHCNCSATNEY